MNFFETLKYSTKKVYDDFVATKVIWHNPSAGMIREKIIKDVLKQYMPGEIGISSGLCFDSQNKESKQLDLILYDKLFSYRIPFDENFMIFPCESVYGNIEIKTKLDINSLQLSIGNIASLKSLYREDATEFNITPKLELTIGGQRLGKKVIITLVLFSHMRVLP